MLDGLLTGACCSETLVPSCHQTDSQPCAVLSIPDSEEETQFSGDPEETQFESTLPAEGDRSLCYKTECGYQFSCGGDTTGGRLSVLSNRQTVTELNSVQFSVRYSKDKRTLRALLTLVYATGRACEWEACRVSLPTEGHTVRAFVCNLSLAYVGLATTKLCLDFLPGEKLKATLTNALKGPDEFQIMLFECLPVSPLS